MSTGADCHFTEIEPGKWVYALQDWPYGEWDRYTKYGPFPSFAKARNHLDDNHANPGGWSVGTHPTGHVHEWVVDAWNNPDRIVTCDACHARKDEVTS